MKDVEVYNNWDRLQEIWLGDTWPSNFYDDLKSDVRDAFYQLTEWTKEDLKIIENKFKEFGVNVLRPTVNVGKENFIEPKTGKLFKPPICPRDNNAVVGNRLFVSPVPVNSYNHLVSQYNSPIVNLDYNKNNYPLGLSGANIVKLGRDIIFDHDIVMDHPIPFKNDTRFSRRKQNIFQKFYRFSKHHLSLFEKDYRIHFSVNGGHCDGRFMPIRPNLLLATHYYSEYNVVFKNWEKLIISKPTYLRENTSFQQNYNEPVSGHKWSLPGVSYQTFNGYLHKYCKDWIGNYQETYFEVNIIMLDENNMMCIDTSGAHQPLFELLDKKGINIHVVPFRTRSFWDGGLHCITLDTKRITCKKDYFPERGDNGLSLILDAHFNYEATKFLEEYNFWLQNQTEDFLLLI